MHSSSIVDGASASAAVFRSQAALLDPAVDRAMIDRCASFTHHLFKIAVADTITAIPTDRPKDNLTLKMTPLEIRRHQRRQSNDVFANQPDFFATEPGSALLRVLNGIEPPPGYR